MCSAKGPTFECHSRPPPHLIHPQQRNLFIKSSTFKIIAAVIALSLVGCADLERKFATSDGLIDFILAVSGYEQIDAYPAERISRGEGEIITAHARKDSRGAFVFGDVGKRYGADLVTTAWSHVDVIVLDPKNQHLKSLATRFFPSTVPETQRGIRGRSSYFVRLPSLPPAGSTIVVAFHQVPIIQCEYSHDRQADRSLTQSQ
jgi:hypothetical protein